MSGAGTPRTAMVTAGLGILALALVAYLVALAWAETGRVGWDAMTYLAAGERLNAGHALYALGPGDRWIWINPPYWTVPLLYPPTIAVIWRPLAALPAEQGVAVWTFANAVALLLSTGAIIARGGWRPALTALLLAPALAFEIKVGNMHGFILAALLLIHLRPRAGAVAIGVLTAVKLTPAVFLVWLFASGRRREAVIGAAVGAVALGAAILHVGLDQFATYVAAAQVAAPSIISIPGLLISLGAPGPRLIAWVLTAFLVLEVVALRRSRLSWIVAVLAMVLGSPVVNIPTLLLLIAIWIPFGEPARRVLPLARPLPSSDPTP